MVDRLLVGEVEGEREGGWNRYPTACFIYSLDVHDDTPHIDIHLPGRISFFFLEADVYQKRQM